jgi:NAD(P)-dependent dehydrogenase (short-subunit alcohol dehydrogenase family)
MSAKFAIVTGGASGIGRGITRRLLEEKRAPWSVLVVDFDINSIEDAKKVFPDYVANKRVVFLDGDVGQPQVAKDAVKKVVDEFGHLDLLVNNAGGGGFVPFLEQTPQGWWSVLNSNLSSCFFFSQAAAPELEKRRGSIINISSTRALMSEPNTEAYSASKGGICSLTHAMAASLAHKVNVNCICPGWIDVSGPEWGPGRVQLEIKPSDNAQHRSNRVGRPEDIAEAVMYLVGADFISGQSIVIDGGITTTMSYAE